MVQALDNCEVGCVGAWLNDADLWMLVWNNVGECIDEGFNTRVVWTAAHTSPEEKTEMSPEKAREAAWTNEKADESACQLR